MKHIYLTKGKISLVDDEDFEFIVQFKWRTNDVAGKYYGVREIWNGGDRYSEHLHRVILERKLGRKLRRSEITDHKNGDGLDNRRKNLRIANHSQNGMNKAIRSDNTSGYRGIHFSKERQKFEVYLNKNGKRYRFGRFNKLEDAIRIRKEAEREYFKRFNYDNSRSA